MPDESSRAKVRILGPDEWDEKEWGMSYEEFRRGMEHARENRRWVYDSMPKLRKRYLNKWIAVRSKRVVGSDTSHDRLIQRMLRTAEGLRGTEIAFVAPKDSVWII